MATAAAVTRQKTGEGDNNRSGIRILSRGDRFWLAVAGCDHNWSFPQTDKKNMAMAYAANAPYDSHQQCPKCGTMRLFDSDTMEHGPLFEKEVKQHG